MYLLLKLVDRTSQSANRIRSQQLSCQYQTCPRRGVKKLWDPALKKVELTRCLIRVCGMCHTSKYPPLVGYHSERDASSQTTSAHARTAMMYERWRKKGWKSLRLLDNLVPRVSLSSASLSPLLPFSRSGGAGRERPWERGWIAGMAGRELQD